MIRWGILGAGKIADRQMAPAIQIAPEHELAAIMRRNAVQAQDFARKYHVPKAYTTVEDLVSDSEIDAVYIASPPVVHAAQTRQAAEHGKHILCEKPMAMNVAESRQMIDVCRANGVQLMICYYQRFNSRHQQIKKLITEGAIGQVTAARVNFSDYYVRPSSAEDWHHDPRISGGGPLMDLAPHCLDLVRYFCGPVVEVAAMIETLVQQEQGATSPVEDTATLLLRLANGAQAVVTTHWSTANFNSEQSNGIEINGTKGSIVAAPISSKDSSGTLQLLTAAGIQDFSVPPGGLRPHVALLAAFGAALAQGVPVPIPGEEGLAGMAAIQAAYQSAQTGTFIKVE